MRARHLLRGHGVAALHVQARVAGDTGAAIEQFDGGFGRPHLDDMADHAGRHRGKSAAELPQENPAPHGYAAIRRTDRAQPAAAGQGRTIDGVKELAAAGTELTHQTDIEFVDQDPDRAFTSASKKKRRLRSRAKIQRCTISTATSTLAFANVVDCRAYRYDLP